MAACPLGEDLAAGAGSVGRAPATHTHRDTERHTHRDRETHRDTQTHTQRYTEVEVGQLMSGCGLYLRQDVVHELHSSRLSLNQQTQDSAHSSQEWNEDRDRMCVRPGIAQ